MEYNFQLDKFWFDELESLVWKSQTKMILQLKLLLVVRHRWFTCRRYTLSRHTLVEPFIAIRSQVTIILCIPQFNLRLLVVKTFLQVDSNLCRFSKYLFLKMQIFLKMVTKASPLLYIQQRANYNTQNVPLHRWGNAKSNATFLPSLIRYIFLPIPKNCIISKVNTNYNILGTQPLNWYIQILKVN